MIRKNMILLIGLGNPGQEYENTRHNSGFLVLDALAKEHNFPDFALNKNFHAEISQGIITGQKIILAKPQTFMNLSGGAVKEIASYYKITGENLWVVHDDIDIVLGKIKISQDSGAGGHKGIKSIIDNLGTQDFARFRVGIQPEKGKPKNVESFVVKNFTKSEASKQKEAIKKTVLAIESSIKNGLEKAMNEFNQ
jgi:peptidyl-tRNA hydrolase, PTH1 family